MTKESFKSVSQPSLLKKNNTDTDMDADDDLYEGGEFASLTESLEEESTKKNARRKIEIHWEKKRLKELFDDISDSEIDF
ncbi:MAG: hypothetical protein NTU70_10835 [Methylococcales bacterium]|nr:hypothetical protein [Methylococcales bacterium]